jgi:hypothetical protein
MQSSEIWLFSKCFVFGFTTTDDDGDQKYWDELVKRERQAFSKENPRWHLKMETQPDSETP